ncbi:MAG: hypothetical protein R6X06_04885 [Gammaproteobacteria bacterium]
MKHNFYITIPMLLLALLVLPMGVHAQDEVYGWQLMSEQERAEHRAKMQSMKTAEERERFRYEHHQKMEQRAKERGVTLPEVARDRMHDRDMDRDQEGGRGGSMKGPMNGSGGGQRGGGR